MARTLSTKRAEPPRSPLLQEVPASEVDTLGEQVNSEPQDAKLRFKYGKALLNAGNKPKAAIEFLEATALEPSFFLAYHQLTLCDPSKEQLEEAIDRLQHLRDERPKELMLRVALSEILEKRGDFYGAARALIDLTYANAIPAQYHQKILNRIHFLLAQTKDSHSEPTARHEEEGGDFAPVPSAESQRRRNIAAGKNEAQGASSLGRTNLLP